MRTLLLDVVKWDLVIDAAGNIAVAAEPYALAQDAASAGRLFAGELYYDTARGVPYFEEILGKSPPAALIKAHLARAALTVPGVVAATAFLTGVDHDTRKISGQIQVTDKIGRVSGAAI